MQNLQKSAIGSAILQFPNCISQGRLKMELRAIVGLIFAVAFPLSVSFIGAFFSSGGDSDWYKQLKKPPWTPPNWAFPVVWTILYFMMGVASWFIWLHGGFKGQSLPLAVYTFQLLLNFLWTPIFFGLHQVGLALVEILLLWTAIAVTIYLFWHVNSLAAYLLVPYIVWVSLASTINFYIWVHIGDSANSLKKTT
eukprot:c25685_g1_i1 orf=42-626(+)